MHRAPRHNLAMKNYLISFSLVAVLATAWNVLLHPRTAKAQATNAVAIQLIVPGQKLQTQGDVVGFSCTDKDCFVAIRNK